ncbi:hypothetical protein [Sagittula salina]|uniref:Uncharacterized protein n=1 Tax=Sagittula salina TaxID=2820268 RepID=A0A940MSH8_9RHOB|nr:hypothetical protein [Sagittula salina]MBP0485188.1 hypothetical protein [Sagittula salina]
MKNPRKIDHARVTAALEGKLATSELTNEEHAAWVEAFNEKMGEPGEHEEAFFARRRRLGLGVGLDENGNLVYARSRPPHLR